VFVFSDNARMALHTGYYIYKESDIRIPYQNVVTALVAITIPVGIGVMLQSSFTHRKVLQTNPGRILHFDDHLYRRVRHLR